MRVITGSSLTSGIFFSLPLFFIFQVSILLLLFHLFTFSSVSLFVPLFISSHISLSLRFTSNFHFLFFIHLLFLHLLLLLPFLPLRSLLLPSPPIRTPLFLHFLSLHSFLPPTYVPLLYLLNLCSLIVLFRFLSPPSPPRLLLYSKFHILLLQFFFPFLSLFLDISKISLKTL